MVTSPLAISATFKHLLVVYGLARMIQESDFCYTTSMYDIQNRCIPYGIDLLFLTIGKRHSVHYIVLWMHAGGC